MVLVHFLETSRTWVTLWFLYQKVTKTHHRLILSVITLTSFGYVNILLTFFFAFTATHCVLTSILILRSGFSFWKLLEMNLWKARHFDHSTCRFIRQWISLWFDSRFFFSSKNRIRIQRPLLWAFSLHPNRVLDFKENSPFNF